MSIDNPAIRRLSVALTAVALAACAGTAGGTPSTATATPEAAQTRTSEESLAALEALYRARADSATMNVHEADVRFMTGMIGHHAQALVMSHMAPANGASSEIRVLTARIINAQTDEIAVMQNWLRDRGQPVPQVDAAGGVTQSHDMSGHAGHAPDMRMTGMLSPEQLEELRAARGPDFDRLFLTYMIQHHRGAVTMVHELFATDGAAQDNLVFKIASDIQVDQTTEVARMERMLETMR
jgi:uncharacterized protein (DUF305 family)